MSKARRIGATAVALAAIAVPAAIAQPAAAPANYVLKVDFGIGYEVTWSSQTGDPATPCSEWSAVKVTNEVSAKSGLPSPSTIYAIRGLFTNFASLPKSIKDKLRATFGWSQYEFVAVGPAHGTVSRRRVETGGHNWSPDCGTPQPPAFKPPTNDCGDRSFTTKTATLKAGSRSFDGTLQSLSREKKDKFAIAFSVAPAQPLYRLCDVETGSAPDYPFAVGLVLPTGFVAPGLAHMKVGAIRRTQHQYAGQCEKNIEQPGNCRYSLELNVEIRRTH